MNDRADGAVREDVPFLGTDRGVTVVREDQGFSVAFGFDRELSARLQRVAGVVFDKAADVYKVPLAVEGALVAAVKDMRYLHEAIARDRAGIEQLAMASGREAQRELGASAGVVPKVSGYREAGKAMVGEVVNVNDRFAAQLTGHGSLDNAAFVAIHRLADLDRPVMKGDQVVITYDAKGRGQVVERGARAQDVPMGKMVDGVTLDEQNGQLSVAFAFNPSLAARLQRVDGVEFDKERRVFVAPLDKKDFVLRAVGDMRREFVAQAGERETLVALAATKVDTARVHDAFTKDGQHHIGPVIGVTERFVLQSTGQGNFQVHRRDALTGADPVVDHSIDVAYKGGRGTVRDTTQEKALANAQGRGR